MTEETSHQYLFTSNVVHTSMKACQRAANLKGIADAQARVEIGAVRAPFQELPAAPEATNAPSADDPCKVSLPNTIATVFITVPQADFHS